MMTFFWIWLVSMIVQLAVGAIGKYITRNDPPLKYSGGMDPLELLLWVPGLNTVVAIVFLVLVPIYFWKTRKKILTK